ncbi:type II secretion system protein [Bacillus sp. H-16]|uniref:type II secretion system protein n=1 Tax=Alteribacter salitolerans TaxID=2912333 RepID=UPI00196364F3|nr:type II secretion system protein [Alteribacter salitolerans]MBM7097317.1 type II secretion system protein [Alteribacter salitolerans]
MKKCSGFTLVEIVISLFLISLIAGTMLPVYIQIKEERVWLEQERFVHGKLTDLILAYYYDEPELPDSVERNGTVFFVRAKHLEKSELEVCIHWQYKTKTREKCLYKIE